MGDFVKMNRLLGWVTFLVAALVYFLTLEPTASWWDCGEYIATAYKLQVGHPPGAPTFQMIGRFFSLFAFGNTDKVALMINAMSAISSALTILFLFWTITLLARKVMGREETLSRGQQLAVLGSGLVGALAYTFSDSFWFSAVEGEVYAMSSLVTAVTFWAILRWERDADKKHSLKWIILITFLIGLSIGIHLLNLLAIPAITFVYYFKKYKPTTKGMLLVGGLSLIVLAVMLYIIIPGIVSLAGSFELFFVNSIGLPFNSGTIIYFALLIGVIVWGHNYTRRKGMVAFNTVILGLIFLLIGYSSFFMLVIRSNANVPIDENNPEDAIALLSYLNREQYGSYPIFYGHYYNAPIVDYEDGTPIYVRSNEKGKYIVTDDRSGTKPVYDPRFMTVFPRMWSNQRDVHIELYKQYGKVKGVPISVKKNDGTSEVRYRPTFAENLRFFFSYQVGHMYVRYFMWNFAGRQNDIESQGEPDAGNWISGIDFIDSARLGDQSALPDSWENAARNKFYFLPLLLGLIGFFWHFNRSKRDTLVVALLFLMTGLAIVIYLNQYPVQPRERDYAYAGSFYAFAIWIGLGVLALFDAFTKRFGKEAVAAIGLTLATLVLVPGIMAQQGWDDHDRSGKYAARDFAVTYLTGCDPNSVVVTFGDNDTFPLWYVQEVEGFRTDVRVVNHMLASGAWYAQQMFNKVYDSEPLRLTLSFDQYEKGVNDYIPFYERNLKGHTELKEIIGFIASERDQTKLSLQSGKKMNYLPTKKIRLTVDSAKCVDNGIVPLEMAGRIVPYIEWEIRQNALYKNDLLILDFLATSDWERALYLSNPSQLSHILGLDEYLHQEGMVYKFMPVKADNYYPGFAGVNAEKSYEIFTRESSWGNLHDPSVTVDRESARSSRHPKQNHLRTAETLMELGKTEKALEVLDTCLYYFPHEKFPFDMLMLPFAETYISAGEEEKGIEILEILKDRYLDELRYYNSLDPDFADLHYSNEIRMAMTILNRVGMIAGQNGREDIRTDIDSIVFQEY